MPSQTAKQHRFMALCRSNPAKARKKCPPKKVASEYLSADAREGRRSAVKAMLKGG